MKLVSLLRRWCGGTALSALLGFLVATPFAQAQADGSARWSGPFTSGGYIVSSPAIAADGAIYFGAQDRYLYALNPNGTLRWRFLTGDWIDSSPAIGSDGTIYVGSWDGKLYAIAPNGTKRWEFSTGVGNYIYSSPALGADGTIYFGAGDGNFYALRANGTLKWSYPAADWIDSSPAIGANGLIYYGSWDGRVYALRDNGDTATEVWNFATTAPVLASPALGRDGTVYIGSNDGRVYALDGATGAKRWDYATGGTLEGSAAIGPDGAIYVGGSTGYLHALAPDGTLRWRFLTYDPVASTPAVRADGTIIFGTGSSMIYAVNPDGSVKWRVVANDWIDSSPVVASDGTVFVGGYDKRLYAFNGSGSPASRFSEWPMFRRNERRAAQVPAFTPGGRLINLSVRAQVGPGATRIPGFVVAGSAPKPFLVRAVGPSLAQFQVPGFLPQPALELHTIQNGTDTIVAQNSGWGNSANLAALNAGTSRAGAFPLPPGSLDAAIYATVEPRGYSAPVRSANGANGLVLVEVYDGDPDNPTARLSNLSTRGQVGVGNDALTPGMVVGGPGPVRVLLRAIGPTLAQFGVAGAIAQPTLTLFSGNNAIGTNTRWTSAGNAADLRAAAQATGAFALGDTSADSALLATIDPGAYTMRVAGVGNTTGEALVEVYVIP